MNTNPYFPNTHPYLAFCVHRSGIPLLLYLYCLVLVTDPGREIWALLFSVPVLILFEKVVAGRAMRQPFWALGVAFLTAPAAALVSSLSELEAKGLSTLVDARGRILPVIDFERRLEMLWTTENTCALLLAFLFLWALGATIQDHLPSSGAAMTAVEKRARAFLVLFGLGFALSLAVASFALADLRDSMRHSSWEALPVGDKMSFSNPLLKDQRSYEVGDRFFPHRKPVNLSKAEHLSMLGSVADELWRKRFQISQGETHLVWLLAHSLSELEPGDPRPARFAAASLAHSRHWRLGCTEELTAQFRHHTLGYLASSKSSPAELADYRKWIPYLELYDGGGRERQDLTLVMGRKLELWGYEWETSPAELYYALDYLLFPPHEPLEPGLNPESEALQAVLAIRGLQLRGEELPSHYPLSPELGQYQLNYFGGARIVLKEVDPICRPGAVVEFEALEPQEKR